MVSSLKGKNFLLDKLILSFKDWPLLKREAINEKKSHSSLPWKCSHSLEQNIDFTFSVTEFDICPLLPSPQWGFRTWYMYSHQPWCKCMLWIAQQCKQNYTFLRTKSLKFRYLKHKSRSLKKKTHKICLVSPYLWHFVWRYYEMHFLFCFIYKQTLQGIEAFPSKTICFVVVWLLFIQKETNQWIFHERQRTTYTEKNIVRLTNT